MRRLRTDFCVSLCLYLALSYRLERDGSMHHSPWQISSAFMGTNAYLNRESADGENKPAALWGPESADGTYLPRQTPQPSSLSACSRLRALPLLFQVTVWNQLHLPLLQICTGSANQKNNSPDGRRRSGPFLPPNTEKGGGGLSAASSLITYKELQSTTT